MSFSEVPFFYVSGPLIRTIGPRNVVALSQIGYIVRLIYYSKTSSVTNPLTGLRHLQVLSDPWWVLPAELFHGLTFAAMWSATTDYAHGIAPAHLRTTMQASVGGLKRGLGYGLGAIVGGVSYANLGPRRCFLATAALPALSLLFLVILPRINIVGGLRKQGAGKEGLEHWEATDCHEAGKICASGEFEHKNMDGVEIRQE
ncbi:conserved unknown protein [Ectocarpus siliculosus]|uniref:Major facilitator superfamily associated domain-containing protein n=1 Tax=Ectocarpus siliculosus TaxID=2880 RepID=D7G0X9_ECTSI|nr:conserved unknown protein [Ectocarpus siliculosus]|eukprot:CBJ26723.1 conserved unknown protein [Ectocarpus siliculosus]